MDVQHKNSSRRELGFQTPVLAKLCCQDPAYYCCYHVLPHRNLPPGLHIPRLLCLLRNLDHHHHNLLLLQNHCRCSTGSNSLFSNSYSSMGDKWRFVYCREYATTTPAVEYTTSSLRVVSRECFPIPCYNQNYNRVPLELNGTFRQELIPLQLPIGCFAYNIKQFLSTCDGACLKVVFEFEWKMKQFSVNWGPNSLYDLTAWQNEFEPQWTDVQC